MKAIYLRTYVPVLLAEANPSKSAFTTLAL
jgi:hypothetical protein